MSIEQSHKNPFINTSGKDPEFLIIISGCDGPKGIRVAERVRASIATKPIETSEGDIHVTVSLGVTTSAGGETADEDALVRAADVALYRAKHRGRNCVELATAEDGLGQWEQA